MIRKKYAFVMLLSLCMVGVFATPAFAGANDLVLSRFATFNPKEGGSACTNACGYVQPNTQEFHDLIHDLGQVFGPRFDSPSDTLGEAGFAVKLMTSLSFIPNTKQYWQDAVQNRNPPSSLFTGIAEVRKGLPFSFEIAGNLSYLFASQMFDMGAALKWALNEGYYYFPDIAVRGTVNTLMGSKDLNLITAGWDISISKAFAVSGVFTLTPYTGYQQLYIIGSSRLLNAFPQDPRPPQFDTTNSKRDFSPQFVFSQQTEQVNRFFGGLRLDVWIMSFTGEAIFGSGVNQFTLSGGVRF